MVDRGGLENRCPGNRTVGSNPTLSANPTQRQDAETSPPEPFLCGAETRVATVTRPIGTVSRQAASNAIDSDAQGYEIGRHLPLRGVMGRWFG